MEAKEKDRIRELKERYGPSLLILGHFYMSPAVLEQVDRIGDSYLLSVHASQSESSYIVFCGVSFMAESARILCRPQQRVYLPDKAAGCPLADTIGVEQLSSTMKELHDAFGHPPLPVVYVNSTAEVKALAGAVGGVCCTSSNAALIVDSILKRRERVFFLPDRNLGLNTAKALGLKEKEIALLPAEGEPIDERKPAGLSSRVKMIIWKGSCPVHLPFSAGDVRRARSAHPGCRILVHPECDPQVVEKSDFAGSTAQIFKSAQEVPSGTALYIGTELSFIRRLQMLKPECTVLPLRESLCDDMARITLPKLFSTLTALEEEKPRQEVLVDRGTKRLAGEALRRMIQTVEGR